jgi:hypothetical protein
LELYQLRQLNQTKLLKEWQQQETVHEIFQIPFNSICFNCES